MRIDVKTLREYVNKVSLSTTILTFNLDFREDGVHTNVTNSMTTAMVIGKLDSKAFEDYEAIGEIFVKDSRMMLSMLKTFSGDIEIDKVSDNLIKFFDASREVNIMLAEEKICDNIYRKDKPEIETPFSIELEKSILTRVVNDMSLLDVPNVKFVKTGNKFIINVGSEEEYDFIKNIIEVDGGEDISVGIASGFKELVACLTDTVTIKLGTDLPLILTEDTEFISMECFLSPFVRNSD
jgi:hypothetical protein